MLKTDWEVSHFILIPKGIEGVLQKLKVDPKVGLDDQNRDDLQKRDAQFGSNYKPPPVASPFCSFFLGAMDDFMLKILLACAFFSIVIDMSLADAEHRKTGRAFLTCQLGLRVLLFW